MPPTSVPAPIQRVLDAAARKGVTLEVVAFAESTHTAEEAAAAVGADLGQIVKSLVFVVPRADAPPEPIVCLVSGSNRVDVARLAAVTGEPNIRRATAREANELTGFVIGGIPPLGYAAPTRVVMDPDLGRFEMVWAAAGTSTAVFPVTPATLRALSNAVVAPIAEAPLAEAPLADNPIAEARIADHPIAGPDGPAAVARSQASPAAPSTDPAAAV